MNFCCIESSVTGNNGEKLYSICYDSSSLSNYVCLTQSSNTIGLSSQILYPTSGYETQLWYFTEYQISGLRRRMQSTFTLPEGENDYRWTIEQV